MTEATLQSDQNTPTEAKNRVFSGMQPSNALHLGNYLGALKQWVTHQHENDNIFCVVDLHALTTPEEIDPKVLHRQSREVAALYLACGIDPESNLIFIQSHVSEHAELAWVLNCTTPLGWLYRMTQFKAKSDQKESVGAGLLNYPTLMAADILLYDTQSVPVGDDQRQHVELTRDIAIRFNNLFGDVFVLPNATIPPAGARVMSFDEPETKMSKSVARERSGHAVNLLDSPKTIKKTIMSAVTDSERETRFEHASPGVKNLLSLYQVLTGASREEIEATFDGQGYGTLKKAVLEVVMETLEPIQERYYEIMADTDYIEGVLAQGAAQARETAAKTMQRVKAATGLG